VGRVFRGPDCALPVQGKSLGPCAVGSYIWRWARSRYRRRISRPWPNATMACACARRGSRHWAGEIGGFSSFFLTPDRAVDPGEVEVGSGAPIRDTWDSLATGQVQALTLQHQHQHQQPQASSKMTTPLAMAKCEGHDARAELELPKPPSAQLPSKKLFPFKGNSWGVGIPPTCPNQVSIGLVDSLEVPSPTTKKISLSYKAVGKDKSPAHPSPPPSQVPHQHHAENVAGIPPHPCLPLLLSFSFSVCPSMNTYLITYLFPSPPPSLLETLLFFFLTLCRTGALPRPCVPSLPGTSAGLLDTLLSTAVSCVVDKQSSSSASASASMAEDGVGGAAISSHYSKKLASAGEAAYGMHASQHLGKPLAGTPPWKAEGVFYESDHAYFEQQQQQQQKQHGLLPGLLPYSMGGPPVAVCSASADCPSPPLYSLNKLSTSSMTTPAKASLLPSATSIASRLQPPPPPPPYPWESKLMTWSQRRTPLFAFQSVVKRLMLGLPVTPRKSFCRLFASASTPSLASHPRVGLDCIVLTQYRRPGTDSAGAI